MGQPPWRIALDQTRLEEQLTGIGYYAQNLLAALARQDRENFYFIFGRSPGTDLAEYDNFQVVPFQALKLIHLLHFPTFYSSYLKFLAREGAGYRQSVFPATRIVVTIHDCIYELRPEDYTPGSIKNFREMMSCALALAHRVIVPSQATARDLQSLFSYPAEKIRVIPLAPSDLFRKPRDPVRQASLARKFELPPQYFLFVGSSFGRKNLGGVLRALTILKGRRLAIPLLLVGAHYSKGRLDQFLREFAALGNAEIILLGYVPEGELPYLYAGAQALLYPSYYEGFGLPPLEAMAVGTPVVASFTSSLPEVVGPAALLVDPAEPEEIAEAMATLLTDRELRHSLIQRGKKWVARFSWDETARRTLEVYRELLRD